MLPTEALIRCLQRPAGLPYCSSEVFACSLRGVVVDMAIAYRRGRRRVSGELLDPGEALAGLGRRPRRRRAPDGRSRGLRGAFELVHTVSSKERRPMWGMRVLDSGKGEVEYGRVPGARPGLGCDSERTSFTDWRRPPVAFDFNLGVHLAGHLTTLLVWKSLR